ncbi:MAG: tRNA (guanosine(46)-N7)-methyltransferase TrmB [Kiritimatiellia bacterium]
MPGRYRCRRRKTLPERLVPVSDPCKPFDIDALFPDKYPLEVEIGAGTGGFLISRAAACPHVNYLAIERMMGRLCTLDRRASEKGLNNIRLVNLEALYTLHYLLPRHGVRTVYVFFPDPWPKRKHYSNRLFSEFFLNTLWYTLEIGGCVQVATDHMQYFESILYHFGKDRRFEREPPMVRKEDEQTDFEMLFREKGLEIGECAFRSRAVEDEKPLPPITLPPEMLPGK